MQEQHRDSLNALALASLHNGVEVVKLQRMEHLPLRVYSLTHLKAQRARDERRLLHEAKVVQVRPVAAGNLQDVAKACRRHQRCLDPLAFGDRVDDSRAAVDKKVYIAPA